MTWAYKTLWSTIGQILPKYPSLYIIQDEFIYKILCSIYLRRKTKTKKGYYGVDRRFWPLSSNRIFRITEMCGARPTYCSLKVWKSVRRQQSQPTTDDVVVRLARCNGSEKVLPDSFIALHPHSLPTIFVLGSTTSWDDCNLSKGDQQFLKAEQTRLVSSWWWFR